MADGSVVIDTKLDDSGVKKGISNLNSGFSKIGSIAGSALKGTAVALGAVTTAMSAGAIAGAKYNSTIEGYQTSFEVMTGSAEKATDVVEQLKKIGAETPFEMTDLADTTQLLMNYGLTADDSLSKMKMLGDISQGSADKMNRIAMAYGQMSSAGKVSLEDVKQMIEAGFNPLQEISETTGESMASLYDRISKGTISVDEITASMERSTSVGGKYFQSMEKQSQTVAGQISTLKDNTNQLLGSVSTGFSNALGGTILPLLNETTAGLQEAFNTGGLEGFTEAIGPAFADLLTKFTEQLPQILEMGSSILQSLVNGIQQNLPQITQSVASIITLLLETFFEMLPQILDMGIQIILQLVLGISKQLPELIPKVIDCLILIVETLIDNIDLLIDAGIELIIGLADGLIEALPNLIEKIPVIIDKLINAITNNLPKLIEMGIELIVKLAVGLIKAIPQLISKIPQIISSIVNGFANYYSKLGEVGLNLIKGLWNGISNATSWLWGKISGFCSGIVDKIKGFFGIHSPSKVFADEVGQYLALGVGEGFTDNIKSVYKDMKTAVDFQTQKLSTQLSTTASVNKMLTATINVNGDVNMDSTKVGRMVAPAVTRTFRTGGAY